MKFSYLNEKNEENKIKWDYKRFHEVSGNYEASDHCPIFLELRM